MNLDPANIKALFRRSIAQEKCENLGAAWQDCNRVLQLDSTHVLAQKMHARLAAFFEDWATKNKAAEVESVRRDLNAQIGVYYGRTDNTRGYKVS